MCVYLCVLKMSCVYICVYWRCHVCISVCTEDVMCVYLCVLKMSCVYICVYWRCHACRSVCTEDVTAAPLLLPSLSSHMEHRLLKTWCTAFASRFYFYFIISCQERILLLSRGRKHNWDTIQQLDHLNQTRKCFRNQNDIWIKMLPNFSSTRFYSAFLEILT